jgi:hypothetical protein
MTQEDFRKRLDTIGATAQARPAPRATVPERPRATIGHYAFGLFWGLLLGGFVVYLNQSYDLLFRGPDPAPLWALLALAFFLASLLALGVMLVAGLLRLLTGRVGGRRWAVLGSVLIGLGFGAYVGRFALAAGL